MSAMQRRKGQHGERELASLIADLTGWPMQRRVRQHAGDSDLEGVAGWSVECKRHRTATRGDLAAWWNQTVTQAYKAQALPVLFHRPDRGNWRAMWPLAVLMVEQQADCWRGYEWTADTSVEAWAAVARELAATEVQK